MNHPEESRSTDQTAPLDLDADVLVVGYGPVGQTVAGLLGRAGHRVVVLERREGRYETPRAGHFDHEIMRIFQSLGVADEVDRIADPAKLYEFLDPDGEVVARLPRDWDAPSGWEASYHFSQPELEDVLDAFVQGLPTVEVRLSHRVVGLDQRPDHVRVTLADGTSLTARHVVGADGANSTVRELCGIGTQDLGFRGDWLVVDVAPRPGTPIIDIPHTGQVLDPRRPNHMGRVEHRAYRWEFMLVDGDDPADMVRSERIWELIGRWVQPDQADLVRQTVYQFRSVVADTFLDGSVLLAGDAAHVMPPFLGQGMSSGIRDAATLGWVLDLVLRGRASDELLDLYTASRREHVLAFITESMRIGEIVCETDPTRAAARRETMRSADELPPPFEPPVTSGVRSDTPLAGRLGVQPVLETTAGHVRSDDVVGPGFTLLTLAGLDAVAQDVVHELRRAIPLHVVDLGAIDTTEVGDAAQAWLSSAGVTAALVRPDFYTFGSAPRPEDVASLLVSLGQTLHLTTLPVTREPTPAGSSPRAAS